MAVASAVAAPVSVAWGQDTPPPAQIRALNALYPKPMAAVGTDQIAPADAPYYDCVAKRLYMPLTRLIDRPTPPIKERVSAVIAGGDFEDRIPIHQIPGRLLALQRHPALQRR